jgi:FSR family fosmidomycin resistance protein-like MFS transporter
VSGGHVDRGSAEAEGAGAPESTAAPRRRVVDRRGLALLTSTHVVDDLYQGAVPALLPFLVVERGYSYAAVTGITLAATVLSSVVQPVFGVLIDRRSLPWLTPLGLLVAGVGIGLAGISDAYWWTWGAVALSGLGVAAYHPAAARAARAAAGASAQGMSWFAVGGNVGLALGPVVVSPVLLACGVSGTPWLALPALAMAALFIALRRGRSSQASAAEVAAPAGGGSGGTDDWRLFGWLTLLVVLRSVLYFGISSLLALYVITEFGAEQAVASAILTTFLGVGAAATLLGGWLADRRGRLTSIRLGYGLCLPALLLLLAAPGVPATAAAAALLGVAVYLPFSVQTTLGQEYLPTRIGTASGVTLGLAVSAGGAVTPALGALADAHGLAVALAVLLALPPVALLISLRLRDTSGP